MSDFRALQLAASVLFLLFLLLLVRVALWPVPESKPEAAEPPEPPPMDKPLFAEFPLPMRNEHARCALAEFAKRALQHADAFAVAVVAFGLDGRTLTVTGTAGSDTVEERLRPTFDLLAAGVETVRTAPSRREVVLKFHGAGELVHPSAN